MRVSFRYRNATTDKAERRSLAGADFLWPIVQHVLPRGFRRARHSDLLHLLLRFDPARIFFRHGKNERQCFASAVAR